MQISLAHLFFLLVCSIVSGKSQTTSQGSKDKISSPHHGIFDQKVEKIIEILDSKNISQHIINAISQRTLPIDSTPGINTVTRMFEVLPQDVKDTLVKFIPDTINFPGTRLWEVAARRWLEIQAKSSGVRGQLQRSGLLDQARDVVQVNVAKIHCKQQPFLISCLLLHRLRFIIVLTRCITNSWSGERMCLLRCMMRKLLHFETSRNRFMTHGLDL